MWELKVANIKMMLMNTKGPAEVKEKFGVYEIPIEDSEGKERIYIGSVKRSLGKRIREHLSDISKECETTALAKFVKQHRREPRWDETKILVPQEDKGHKST